jgi:hypothetical protein
MTWQELRVESLDGSSVRQLLNDEVAALIVHGFLDVRSCEESRARLSDAPRWSFYEGSTPPMGRLGMTQYEHYGAKERYLSQAAPEMQMRDQLLRGLPDPLQMLISHLNAVGPFRAAVASEEGRTYFAGIFRRGTAVAIHSDWAPRDAQGWAIGEIRAQLGWNLYYDLPERGGELVVYRRQWTPDMETHARQRFNDYDPDQFERIQHVEIHPKQGDLVLFNGRNAHRVKHSPEGERRLSVGSFIGELPDGQLLFWS